MKQELVQHYNQYFYSKKANTQELRDIAYQLRYQVFIEECDYHPGTNIVDQMERDEYDAFSFHSLLYHKPTNQPIGYIRLIPNSYPGQKLPTEKYCKNNLDLDVLKPGNRIVKFGEISRMLLIKKFRRRPYDSTIQGAGIQIENEDHNRRFKINYLPICLMVAGFSLAIDAKLDYAILLLDQQLSSLIERYGVKLMKIGDAIELDGVRTPYMIYLKETQERFSKNYLGLFNQIHHQLNFENHELSS